MLACGVQRNVARSVIAVVPQRVDIEVRQEPVGAEYKMFPEVSLATAAISVPEISFQPQEYQHVRVSGVGMTLPADGLKIWLDGLAGEFTYPVQGKLISDYGMRRGRPHTGVDLKAAHKDTIRAVMPGVVRMSKLYSSYGNIVVIRHYNGLETVYSHNTQNLVSPDEVVISGQPIALAGRTGRATTDHLHFEVRAAGEPIDPKLLIDHTTMSIRSGWLFITEKNNKIIAASSIAELEAIKTPQPNTIARDQALAQSEIIPKTTTPEPVYYIVKYGDILGRIAQKHNTTVAKLCSLNNLKSPDRIREGQQLRVK
jgi:LysM repeat protein